MDAAGWQGGILPGPAGQSAEEKQRNNAERQRRFRAKRQAELKQLRAC